MKAHRPKLARLSVEYNLTEHCNLSCALCDHAAPLLAERFAVLEEFERDLAALGAVLHSRQLRIVGGEPLLHPRLLDFLRAGRRAAVADRIVVITNGTRLHAAPDEFWALVDELWLSVYPGVRRRLDVAACRRLCRNRGIVFRADDDRLFQETLLNGRLREPTLVRAVFDACAFARECHTVYDGRFYLCSVAPLLGPRLARLGIAARGLRADGIRLRGNPRLYEQLRELFARTRPLAACSWCLGSSGPLRPHRQLTAAGLKSWLREDQAEAVAFVRRRLLPGGRA